MAEIDVEPISAGERSKFRVVVREGADQSTHEVTLSESDAFRLGSGYPSEEALVRESFQFLLEREPKEAILRRFDVSEISRYFPEFEERIRRPG